MNNTIQEKKITLFKKFGFTWIPAEDGEGLFKDVEEADEPVCSGGWGYLEVGVFSRIYMIDLSIGSMIWRGKTGWPPGMPFFHVWSNLSKLLRTVGSVKVYASKKTFTIFLEKFEI